MLQDTRSKTITWPVATALAQLLKGLTTLLGTGVFDFGKFLGEFPTVIAGHVLNVFDGFTHPTDTLWSEFHDLTDRLDFLSRWLGGGRTIGRGRRWVRRPNESSQNNR